MFFLIEGADFIQSFITKLKYFNQWALWLQSESDISRIFSQEVGSAVLFNADLQLATAFSRWEGGISRSLANAHNLTYTSPKATDQQRYLALVGFFCDDKRTWKNYESCGRIYFWSSLQFQPFPYVSLSATPSLLSCAEHLESASNNHLEFLKGIIWWDFSSP